MRFLVSILMLLAALTASATDWYVDSSATGSGNGTSWANAWTNLNLISGPAAGDTVYISGGSSGSSQTYNRTIWWEPVGGTAGTNVIYKIGQDASHNGTAIFQQISGDNEFVTGTFFTLSGDAGDGVNHFVTSNFCTAAVLNNFRSAKIEYLTSNATNGIVRFADLRRGGAATTNIEIFHCTAYVTNAAADGAIYGELADADYDGTKIHGNNIDCVRGTTGLGADGLQINGSGFSIYSNLLAGVTNTFSGGQHADGWQSTGGGNKIKIFANTVVDLGNYGLFGEAVTGGYSNVFIYDNVILLKETTLNSGSPAGIVFGVGGGFSGTAPCTFTNLVIGNNTIVDFIAHDPIALNNVTTNVPVFTNCLIQNNVSVNSGSINTTGNTTSLVSHNAAVTAANATNYFTSYTLLGGTNNDLHLTALATPLIATGTNMSAFYTLDADSVTFTNSVGAFQYVADSGGPTPAVTNRAQKFMSLRRLRL